jgi:endonuclease YncB( thermonuclease family)
MPKKAHIRYFLALALLFLPPTLYAGQYKVIRVHDGDTLTTISDGKEIKVRLVGVDAPELSIKSHLPGQPFSIKAKEYLASLVLNKSVAIKFYNNDLGETSLGEIFVDEVNINIEMLRAGLAEVYRGKPANGLDIAKYRDAENKAKQSVTGIWELRDQYFSPWDWREIYR